MYGRLVFEDSFQKTLEKIPDVGIKNRGQWIFIWQKF